MTGGVTGGELAVILMGWLVALASPGPATLSIAGEAMAQGRRRALALASGVFTGSAFWALAAALGLGALLIANAWLLEILRYVGAAYLTWLAFRSLRSALRPAATGPDALDAAQNGDGADGGERGELRRAYWRGLAIHLTNPKAPLFWGALFAVVVSPDAPLRDIVTVGGACITLTCAVFTLYALMFSTRRAARSYLRLRRVFDAAFALCFGAAGLKILTARLT